MRSATAPLPVKVDQIDLGVPDEPSSDICATMNDVEDNGRKARLQRQFGGPRAMRMRLDHECIAVATAGPSSPAQGAEGRVEGCNAATTPTRAS